MRLQTGSTEPAGFGQLTTMGAGCFDPVQSFCPAPAIVTGETEKPQSDDGSCDYGINEEKAAHKCL